MYADDNVLYYRNEEALPIEHVLTNENMKHLSDYFVKNQLIINLNKGKRLGSSVPTNDSQ